MSEAAFTRIAVSAARASGGGFNAVTPGYAHLEATQPPAARNDDRYENGYEAGKREARMQFDSERDALLTLLASAEALAPEPSEELAVLIAETVERLVSQIVSTIEVRSDWLAERAARAAALIGEADQARTMWLHPADLELIDAKTLSLQALPDPQAERGSIRIDCSAGWIESGIALHLDALRTELGISADAA